MTREFEKTNDPEAERDRRSSSASGSERAGEAPLRPAGNPEAGAKESMKDSGDWPNGASILTGESAGEDAPFRETIPVPRLGRATRRRFKKAGTVRHTLTAEQRLLILDTWKRSGLPGTDFATVVGISSLTLYSWKKRFESEGPAGLVDKPKGPSKGSGLPELTRRTILMLKEANPDWGCQRISDMLLRGPALPASPSAVAQVLHDAGYEMEEAPTHPHPDHPREFERAKPNQLWQTDLFTFILKRQNRRVYLVAFLDSCEAPGYVEYGVESQAVLGFRRPRLHINRFV